MSAPVVVAVDGGGSKTDVVAVGLDGSLRAHVRGPGSQPQVIGLEPALAIIDRLVGEVLAAAGDAPLARAGVYLAGLDLPAEYAAAREGIAACPAFGGAPVQVENDLFALLRSGAANPDAVALVCGTGINAIARRSDGATVRYPSLGTISGDWGGGGDLGPQALWHAARSADGRGPKSVLEELVAAAFGLPDVAAVIEGLHFGRIPERSLAHLTPVLFEAAHRGDACALGEIRRQADEIVVMAAAAMRRLGLEQLAPQVVLGGGVLAAADPLLLDPVREGLLAIAPRATVDLVHVPPILGAVLLVLEATDADQAVLDAARTAILERFAAGISDYADSAPLAR
jgi:N-acetylglucosamine kinase-like BadF-type ATPase